MQRAFFICLLNLLLLRKGQSIHIRPLLSYLCLDGIKVYLASPAEQACPKRWEVGSAQWGLGEGSRNRCWGAPWGFGGAAREWGAAQQVAGTPQHWDNPASLPTMARLPRVLQAGCLPQQFLACRAGHTGSGRLAVCLVMLGQQSVMEAALVTSTRHPNDSCQGEQAGDASCCPLGKLDLLPIPTGSQGAALTSSRSSYWSMMLFSFSASSVFSWQSFMFLSLCCSI